MILLLQRSPVFRLEEWLADAAHDAVLFTQLPEGGAGFADVVRIPSFDADGRTELRVVEQHARTPFSAIAIGSEYDVIRAARLRERLDIPGQSVPSAIAYRDKARMKELARAHGVPVAEFRRIESPLDLEFAAREWGYPLIVKPVDGGGSRGVTMVRDAAELDALLAGGCPANAMVERFIAGDMFHVDGVARDGAIAFSVVSRYFNGCLAFQSGESLGSALLEPSSALFERMNAAVAQVVAALPALPVLGYHCEFFLTPADEIVLCEIASRLAYWRMTEAIEAAYGVNLNRVWTRWQCGLPDEIAPRFTESAGFLLIPNQSQGRLLEIPDRIPFDWTTRYYPLRKPGEVVGSSAASSVDNIATMIVRGPDEATVSERLRELNDWYLRSLVWEPAPAGA